MSRGLGRMQRLVLDELKARSGGDMVGDRNEQSKDMANELKSEYGVWLCDRYAQLKPGVHDLRCVCYQLAVKHGGISHANFTSPEWQASFSRAVKGLHARGYIEVINVVPVQWAREDGFSKLDVHHLADGTYIVWNSRQKRFCKC